MRRHVLVVDDDDDVRDGIADLLQAEGFAVSVAIDGVDALDQLRSGADRPSLILLDLMMPRMTGWQLLEHLRADPALGSIPVCVVSASGASAPDGAQHAVRKPFDPEVLLEVVGKYATLDGASPTEPSCEAGPRKGPD